MRTLMNEFDEVVAYAKLADYLDEEWKKQKKLKSNESVVEIVSIFGERLYPNELAQSLNLDVKVGEKVQWRKDQIINYDGPGSEHHRLLQLESIYCNCKDCRPGRRGPSCKCIKASIPCKRQCHPGRKCDN